MANTNTSGVLPIAFTLLGVGAVMTYSAFKGLSIVDVFAGKEPPPRAPNSPTNTVAPDAQDRSNVAKATGPGQFKGPNALLLESVRLYAETRFGLRVSQICRPANATYGAAKSKHKECRAMDLVGTPANMMAFARWANALPWGQVFYDPAGLVAPGFSHVDHVHFGDT